MLTGPYVDIRVTNSENAEYNLDAVFLSPHKFVGAAGGTPGVLVAKRCLFSNDIPTFAGGGTVKYALAFAIATMMRRTIVVIALYCLQMHGHSSSDIRQVPHSHM